MSTPPSTFLIAFGWSTDKPCISHMYCSCVRLRTSCSLRGQLNFPSSSRLYSRRNLSASHSSSLRRFLRLPQNRNALLEKGQACTAAGRWLPVRQWASSYPYVRRQCRYFQQLSLSAFFQTSQQRKEKLLRYIWRHFDLDPVLTNDHLLRDSWFNLLGFNATGNTLCLHRSCSTGDALRNTQRYDLLQGQFCSFQQFFSHHIQA